MLDKEHNKNEATYKEHTTVTTEIGVLNNQPPAYTYDGEIEKVLTPGIKRRNWKIGKLQEW